MPPRSLVNQSNESVCVHNSQLRSSDGDKPLLLLLESAGFPNSICFGSLQVLSIFRTRRSTITCGQLSLLMLQAGRRSVYYMEQLPLLLLLLHMKYFLKRLHLIWFRCLSLSTLCLLSVREFFLRSFLCCLSSFQ